MSEKRFEINDKMSFDDKIETYELTCVVDNETKNFYFVVDSLANIESFVNRLNDLDTFREGYFGLEKQIKQLRDENHRLRLTMSHLGSLNLDIEWLKEHIDEWKK